MFRANGASATHTIALFTADGTWLPTPQLGHYKLNDRCLQDSDRSPLNSPAVVSATITKHLCRLHRLLRTVVLARRKVGCSRPSSFFGARWCVTPKEKIMIPLALYHSGEIFRGGPPSRREWQCRCIRCWMTRTSAGCRDNLKQS